MANVTHSEYEHEQTPFERFTQLAKKVAKVKREETRAVLSKENDEGERGQSNSGDSKAA